MLKQLKNKPLAAAVSAALATSVATIPTANADVSPFSATPLPDGYMVAGTGEGSCGEGSCGTDKESEGSCGEKDAEGSCGEKDAEGSCGGDKESAAVAEEAADSGKAGSGSTGVLSLLGLLSVIGLRRRIKRS